MAPRRTANPIRKLSSLPFVLAGLLVVGPAAGQSSDSALAEALFKDARTLMQAGKLDEACPKFAESHRLVPKLGTLLNLATCHDKQGKTGSAWDEYTQAVTLAKQANEPERIEYARLELEKLEVRLSKLVVRVESPVGGIDVRVDGRPIGRAAWGTPIPLDPGEHEVEATADGHEPWSSNVTVPPGPSQVEIQVPALAVDPSAGTKPAAATSPTAPGEGQESGTSGQAMAAWVLGGLGIVGIGVGTGFGINTFVKQGNSDDHCDGTFCDQEGVDLRSAAKTSAVVSDIAFAVGAAATLTAIILLATDEGEEAPVAQEGSIRRSLWIGARSTGAGAAVELGGQY